MRSRPILHFSFIIAVQLGIENRGKFSYVLKSDFCRIDARKVKNDQNSLPSCSIVRQFKNTIC